VTSLTTVIRVAAADPDGSPGLTGTVAELTRTAYAAAVLARPDVDPLPRPDGADDTAAGVAAQLADGVRVFLAHDGETAVGAARVRTLPDRRWRVERVAVAPTYRRLGVGRALLAGIEAAAMSSTVDEVTLFAVIERRLASWYGRLGYRIAERWPAPDKPLTEATMYRRPAEPVIPYVTPGAGDEAVPATAVVTAWWRDGSTGSVECIASPDVPATLHQLLTDRPAELYGLDLWPGGDRTDRERILTALGGRAEATGLRLPRAPHRLAAYHLPRTLAGSNLAWWRPLTDPREGTAHA
jgi:ribosomal protein S18 acetylase RimI-like enzyme